jgi:hypothetical protein
MLDQIGDSVQGSPAEINLGGLEGVQVVVRGFGEATSHVVLLESRERVLLVQTWQPGRLFDRIMETLRAIGDAD